MVLITGEITESSVRVCLLEASSQTFRYRTEREVGGDLTVFVPAYIPTFVDIPLTRGEQRTKFVFRSGSGPERRGSVSNRLETSYVVACNNPYTYKDCTIWPTIAKNPTDVLFHLGDNVYCDRIFWMWFYQLDNVKRERWSLYREDIIKDFYSIYIDTWTPLEGVLANCSNIMIPDDHESRSKAEIILDNAKEYYSKDYPKVKKFLVDEIKTVRQQEKEKFIFECGFEACRTLYLGMRYTNRDTFDYFGYVGGVPVVLTERVTHKLFDEEFLKRLESFTKGLKIGERLMMMSGLPSMPIRQSMYESMLYREEEKIPKETYNNLYDLLKRFNCIYIGGDTHVGMSGEVIDRETGLMLGRVYICGPSSGFCSAYLDQSCIANTDKYKFKVSEFRATDPNCVYVNLKSFESRLIAEPSSSLHFVYNLASTCYAFWC